MTLTNFTYLLLNGSITGFPTNVTISEPPLGTIGRVILLFIKSLRAEYFDSTMDIMSPNYWMGISISFMVPLLFAVVALIYAILLLSEEASRYSWRLLRRVFRRGKSRKATHIRWLRRYFGTVSYFTALGIIILASLPAMAGLNVVYDSVDGIGLLSEEGVEIGKSTYKIAESVFNMVNFTFYTVDRVNTTIEKYLPSDEFINMTLKCINDSLSEGVNETVISSHLSSMDFSMRISPNSTLNETLKEFNATISQSPNRTLIPLCIEDMNNTVDKVPKRELSKDLKIVREVNETMPDTIGPSQDCAFLNNTKSESWGNVSDAALRSKNLITPFRNLRLVLNHTYLESLSDIAIQHADFNDQVVQYGNLSDIGERVMIVESVVANSPLNLTKLYQDLVRLNNPGLDIAELQTRVTVLELELAQINNTNVSLIIQELEKLNNTILNTTFNEFADSLLVYNTSLVEFDNTVLINELTVVTWFQMNMVNYTTLTSELLSIHNKSLYLPNMSRLYEDMNQLTNRSNELAEQLDRLSGEVEKMKNFTSSILLLNLSDVFLNATIEIVIDVEEIYDLLYNETSSLRDAMYCIGQLLDKIRQINESMFDISKFGLNISESLQQVNDANDTLYDLESYLDIEGMLANMSTTIRENEQMASLVSDEVSVVEQQVQNASNTMESLENLTSLNTSSLRINMTATPSSSDQNYTSESDIDIATMQNIILDIPEYAESLDSFSLYNGEMSSFLRSFVISMRAAALTIPDTMESLVSSVLLFQEAFNELKLNISRYVDFFSQLQSSVDEMLPEIVNVRHDLDLYVQEGFGNKSMMSTEILESMLKVHKQNLEERQNNTFLSQQITIAGIATEMHPPLNPYLVNYEFVDNTSVLTSQSSLNESVGNLTQYEDDISGSRNFMDLAVSLVMLKSSLKIGSLANQTEEALRTINETKHSLEEDVQDGGQVQEMNLTSIETNMTALNDIISNSSSNASNPLENMGSSIPNFQNYTGNLNGMLGNMSISEMVNNMTGQFFGQIAEYESTFESVASYKDIVDNVVDGAIGFHSSHYGHTYYQIAYYVGLIITESVFLNLILIWLLGALGIIIHLKSLTRFSIFSYAALSLFLCILCVVMVPGTILLDDACTQGVSYAQDTLRETFNSSYTELGIDTFQHYAYCNASDPFNVSSFMNDTKYMIVDMLANMTDFEDMGLRGELLDAAIGFEENVINNIPVVVIFAENMIQCKTVSTRYSVLSESLCTTFLYGSVLLWVGILTLVTLLLLAVVPLMKFSTMSFRIHSQRKKKEKNVEGVSPENSDEEEPPAAGEEEMVDYSDQGEKSASGYSREVVEELKSALHKAKGGTPMAVQTRLKVLDGGSMEDFPDGIGPTAGEEELPKKENAEEDEYKSTRLRRSFSNASYQSLQDLGTDFTRLDSTTTSTDAEGYVDGNPNEGPSIQTGRLHSDDETNVITVNRNMYRRGYQRVNSIASSEESYREERILNTNHGFVLKNGYTQVPDKSPDSSPDLPDGRREQNGRKRSTSDAPSEHSFRLKFVDLKKSSTNENVSQDDGKLSKTSMYKNFVLHPVRRDDGAVEIIPNEGYC